jgi:hypothetical protein
MNCRVRAIAVILYIDILDAMNRASRMATALLVGMAAGRAFASDSYGHAVWMQTPAAKRQTVKMCMSRKMTADRTLSYNAAVKVCTAMVKPPPAETASNTPLK